MTDAPSKVLITGGHELGGVSSVAAGLANGFGVLGIPAEIIPPSSIFSHWRDLRDSRVLKILSTTAVFAAPFARRAICIAHGLPCADVQGWARMSSIIASFKLANACGAQLVAVSGYTAVHLQNIFNIRVDAVIHNPLKPLYLDPPAGDEDRKYITYIGRLIPAKNLHRLLPAICDLLEESSELRACIIGDGPLRAQLQASVQQHPRIEFKGSLPDPEVRAWLRRTKLFLSGNCTEGLGVVYLEALSQGCVVAMPASGGGIELALDAIGTSVHLMPPLLDKVGTLPALRHALKGDTQRSALDRYTSEACASGYLALDGRRQAQPHGVADRRSISGQVELIASPSTISRASLQTSKTHATWQDAEVSETANDAY
jgi:glycosyltransferase involved in cell wall biosynthesis